MGCQVPSKTLFIYTVIIIIIIIVIIIIRNFQCIQTFQGKEMSSGSRMSCFFHSKLPSNNAMQKEDDSRIFAASKNIFSFDQARVVHEATTDYTNVTWLEWVEESCTIISASKNNAIVWDALIGSKKFA